MNREIVTWQEIADEIQLSKYTLHPASAFNCGNCSHALWDIGMEYVQWCEDREHCVDSSMVCDNYDPAQRFVRDKEPDAEGSKE